MDEQLLQEVPELDILDLTNVETNRPLMPEGTTRMVLKGFKTEENKAKSGKNLLVILETTQALTATNGKPLSPGWRHTERISLVQTEKYDPKENLARLQECFLGVKGPFKSSELINREGEVKVKIERSDEFGNQNRITFIKKKVDAPTLT